MTTLKMRSSFFCRYLILAKRKKSTPFYQFLRYICIVKCKYTEIEINQAVASKSLKELYFYMAPNFNDNTGANAVRLNIEGKDPVILSNGSPSDSPRDYNLYHNSNYTFTINFK